MPPQRPRDGKSRATLCRQGTRLGKRQRAEARQLEQMKRHDRAALPPEPPRSSAGSSMDLPQRPAGPEPAGEQGASAKVEQPQHVGVTATSCECEQQNTQGVRCHLVAPALCQPGGQSMPSTHYPPAAPALCQSGGLPYMAPYCPPTLPLQCIHPPVEEDPIGAAWTEPIPPARAPVVTASETEPSTGPMTESGRLTRDQPNGGNLSKSGRPVPQTCLPAPDPCTVSGRNPTHPPRPPRIVKMLHPSQRIKQPAWLLSSRVRRNSQTLHPAQKRGGSARSMDQRCLRR